MRVNEETIGSQAGDIWELTKRNLGLNQKTLQGGGGGKLEDCIEDTNKNHNNTCNLATLLVFSMDDDKDKLFWVAVVSSNGDDNTDVRERC